MKIGRYTEDEILEHLTEGEGRGFLGRSMYDAIFDKIHALITENEELKNRLCETELWLRACIIELMKNAEKDYYWIMNHQIENSKNITIGYSMAGNGDIQFYELKDSDD